MCSVALLKSLRNRQLFRLISASCRELSYSSIPLPGEHGGPRGPPMLGCRGVIRQ